MEKWGREEEKEEGTAAVEPLLKGLFNTECAALPYSVDRLALSSSLTDSHLSDCECNNSTNNLSSPAQLNWLWTQLPLCLPSHSIAPWFPSLPLVQTHRLISLLISLYYYYVILTNGFPTEHSVISLMAPSERLHQLKTSWCRNPLQSQMSKWYLILICPILLHCHVIGYCYENILNQVLRTQTGVTEGNDIIRFVHILYCQWWYFIKSEIYQESYGEE